MRGSEKDTYRVTHLHTHAHKHTHIHIHTGKINEIALMRLQGVAKRTDTHAHKYTHTLTQTHTLKHILQ